MDEHSYFSNYDEIVAAKEEVIIVSKHNHRPYIANFGQLTKLIKSDTFDISSIRNDYTTSVKADFHRTTWIDIQYPTLQTVQFVTSFYKLFRSTVDHLFESGDNELQQSDNFEHYHFTSISERHVIPGTNIWSSVGVRILLPNSSSLAFSFHYGPVAFVSQTLRALLRKGAIVEALQRAEAEEEGREFDVPIDSLISLPSPTYLLYVIIDGIVDRLVELVDFCESEVFQIEHLVEVLSASEQIDVLRRIADVGRRIGSLRNQLFRKKDILTELVGVLQQPVFIYSDGKMVKSSLKIYFRDILDHVQSMLVKLTHAKINLTNASNIYTTTLSIQLNLSSQQLSRLMKFFSSMATIFLPLGVFPSFFGMNIPIPGENSSGLWVIGVIGGSVAVVAVLAIVLFWKIKWLC